MNKNLTILGIETSCDDTSIALIKCFKNRERKTKSYQIISANTSSQIKVHKKYNGVFPELASREHVKNILPVLQATLKNIDFKKDIDLIAIAKGPGLVGSLIPGVCTAKTLGMIYEKPVIGVNHLFGHICANLLNEEKITFPAVALIISGGHTSLIKMTNFFLLEEIGFTLDDAVGEAYDKVAIMLEGNYPGGPFIDKLAEQYKPKENEKLIFPTPMINHQNDNFSFSGLKTAVLYYIKNLSHPLTKEEKNKIAWHFQQSVIKVLLNKSFNLAKKIGAKTIIVSGGVSANKTLRQNFQTNHSIKNYQVLFPDKKLSTDNGVMIAIGADVIYEKNYLKFPLNKFFCYNTDINPNHSLECFIYENN